MHGDWIVYPNLINILLVPVSMNSLQDPRLSCIRPTECPGTGLLSEQLHGFSIPFSSVNGLHMARRLSLLCVTALV